MSTPSTYDVGDRVKLDVVFKDNTGAEVDPTEVELQLRRPDGTTVSYTHPTDSEIQKEATGVYSHVLTTEHSGQHDFHWKATGPGAGVEEGRFWVRLNALG